MRQQKIAIALVSSVLATPRRLFAATRGDPPRFRALLEADGKAVGFASFRQTFSSCLAQPGIRLA